LRNSVGFPAKPVPASLDPPERRASFRLASCRPLFSADRLPRQSQSPSRRPYPDIQSFPRGVLPARGVGALSSDFYGTGIAIVAPFLKVQPQRPASCVYRTCDGRKNVFTVRIRPRLVCERRIQDPLSRIAETRVRDPFAEHTLLRSRILGHSRLNANKVLASFAIVGGGHRHKPVATPAVNSWQTPSWRPRAWPRNRRSVILMVPKR
jgi:hypothetical protein